MYSNSATYISDDVYCLCMVFSCWKSLAVKIEFDFAILWGRIIVNIPHAAFSLYIFRRIYIHWHCGNMKKKYLYLYILCTQLSVFVNKYIVDIFGIIYPEFRYTYLHNCLAGVDLYA